MTNNLTRRLFEHRHKLMQNSFTDKYYLDYLVYFEQFKDALTAIEREKQLKKWGRDKKNKLIAALNPAREDLSTSLEMTD